MRTFWGAEADNRDSVFFGVSKKSQNCGGRIVNFKLSDVNCVDLFYLCYLSNGPQGLTLKMLAINVNKCWN